MPEWRCQLSRGGTIEQYEKGHKGEQTDRIGAMLALSARNPLHSWSPRRGVFSKMKSISCLSVLAGTALFSLSLSGGTIVFHDETFAANWTSIATSFPGCCSAVSGANNSQILSGGNPGAFLQVEVGNTQQGGVQALSLNSLFTYDLSLGAVLSISYSYDVYDIRSYSDVNTPPVGHNFGFGAADDGGRIAFLLPDHT